jgi:hypothetical protein
MYINVVAGSVMLYLQHDLYDIIFEVKSKVYIASGSAPPKEKSWVCAWYEVFKFRAIKINVTINWKLVQITTGRSLG